MPSPMYQPVEVGASVLIWPSGSDSKLPSSTDATPASAGVQTRAARPNPDKAKQRSLPTCDSPNLRAPRPAKRLAFSAHPGPSTEYSPQRSEYRSQTDNL